MVPPFHQHRMLTLLSSGADELINNSLGLLCCVQWTCTDSPKATTSSEGETNRPISVLLATPAQRAAEWDFDLSSLIFRNLILLFFVELSQFIMEKVSGKGLIVGVSDEFHSCYMSCDQYNSYWIEGNWEKNKTYVRISAQCRSSCPPHRSEGTRRQTSKRGNQMPSCSTARFSVRNDWGQNLKAQVWKLYDN